jgi:hypothetical protein
MLKVVSFIYLSALDDDFRMDLNQTRKIGLRVLVSSLSGQEASEVWKLLTCLAWSSLRVC